MEIDFKPARGPGAGPAADIAAFGRPARGGLGEDQALFSSVLGRETRRVLPERTERAREAAEQFVSLALVQPILKQARESGWSAGPPFGASKAEKQFLALRDADFAERIVKKADWPLVDRLAERLAGARGSTGGGA